jgi:hypothetical protein
VNTLLVQCWPDVAVGVEQDGRAGGVRAGAGAYHRPRAVRARRRPQVVEADLGELPEHPGGCLGAVPRRDLPRVDHRPDRDQLGQFGLCLPDQPVDAPA